MCFVVKSVQDQFRNRVAFRLKNRSRKKFVEFMRSLRAISANKLSNNKKSYEVTCTEIILDFLDIFAQHVKALLIYIRSLEHTANT
jgi:hypothetical protein